MATQMEQDAALILTVLAEWSEKPDDEETGRYAVKGEELQQKSGLPPQRINDAVELLTDSGYVNVLQTLGSAPFNFWEVSLEISGRMEYQRLSQITEAQSVPELDDMEYDVFLSHSSLDDELTEDVRQILIASGLSVFATPASIPTGSWEPQIEDALRSSRSIWVLLTPHAVRASVWTHQEFGFFYGFNQGNGSDKEGHRCRYLFTRGTERRGLYAWFQGNVIDSFEDPEIVAKEIVSALGSELVLPPRWVSRKYPERPTNALSHPTFGRFSLAQSGNIPSEGSVEVQMTIHQISEPIYHVSVITGDPMIEVEVRRPLPVMSPAQDGELVFHARWRKPLLEEIVTEGVDSRGRVFDLTPGPRAPEMGIPLLVTFEAEDGRAIAAVYYFNYQSHPKGFPEINFVAQLPMDWREGKMPG